MKFLYSFLVAVATVTAQDQVDTACVAECTPKCEKLGVAACAKMCTIRCTPRKDGSDCTLVDIKACAKPSQCAEATETAEAVNPKREGCCITCYKAKPENMCSKKPETCEMPATECVKPTGRPNKADFIDFETCCPTCSRPGASKEKDGKGKAPKCSKSDFLKCMEDPLTLPCDEDEKPERDGLCCNRCKRSDVGKALKKLGRCGKVPECADGEEPASLDDVDGEPQCKTCKRPRPNCAGGCGKDSVCVRGKGEDATPKCVNKKMKKMKIRAKKALKASDDTKEFIQGATEEEIRAMLVELVERFCDQAENQEECDANRQTLIDGLVVRIMAKKEAKEAEGADDTEEDVEEVDVEVDVPEATSRRRNLLAASTPADLLDSAVADNDDSEIDVTDGDTADDDESGSVRTQATWVAAGLVGLAAMLAM